MDYVELFKRKNPETKSRFQGLSFFYLDQRLLNCGALRAALRPYFSKLHARKPLYFLIILIHQEILTRS